MLEGSRGDGGQWQGEDGQDRLDKEQRLAGGATGPARACPRSPIPTVVGFVDGRPVDMFQALVPQGQIKEFIDRLAAMGGDGGLPRRWRRPRRCWPRAPWVDAQLQTFAAGSSGEEPEGMPRPWVALRARTSRRARSTRPRASLNTGPRRHRHRPPSWRAVRAQIALGPAGRETRARWPISRPRSRADSRQPAGAVPITRSALHAAAQVQEAGWTNCSRSSRREREWNEGAAKDAALHHHLPMALSRKDIALNGRAPCRPMILPEFGTGPRSSHDVSRRSYPTRSPVFPASGGAAAAARQVAASISSSRGIWRC